MLLLLFSVVCPTAAYGGAVPDRSLGRERSRVERGNVNGLPSEVVSGGARRNRALFHSFRRLSVEAGQRLYFQSPDGVTNILTRVTGSNISQVSGTLGVLGNANLVLMNPNGIRFSNGARLDLRGSFLATTASSVDVGRFRFNSRNPAAVPPLLSVDVPTGLNFDRFGRLIVNGTGHQVDFLGPAPVAIDNPITGAGQSPVGLRVAPSQTLALVGGNVRLSGAVLSAPSGAVELGGVRSGQVGVKVGEAGWDFDYSRSLAGDIRLQQLSLLDASGFGGGRLGLTGRNITLSDGSYGIIQNIGLAPSLGIEIQAERGLSMIGSTATNRSPSFRIAESRSGFISNTFTADSANLDVTVGKLSLDRGGILRSLTYGSGNSGDIVINSRGDVSLNRLSPLDRGTGVNVIQTFTAGSGDSGNILLNAAVVELWQGSNINTATASILPNAGRGGNINIRARDVDINGITTIFRFPSAISTSVVGSGTGGNVRLSVNDISVTNGGGLGTITFGVGDAGDLRINADDILLANQSRLAPFAGIYAAAVISTGQFEVPLDLPESPVGEAGDLFIRANSIDLRSGGGIAATNAGSQASAGSIRIDAHDVSLKDDAVITAATNGGQGGNIQLNLDESLVLQNGSIVDATARRRSNGGNVQIDADTVALLNRSRIRANAQSGQGGRVSIDAAAIFLSPDSAITATSRFSPSLDGSIDINAIDVRSRQGELNTEIPLRPPSISATCQTSSDNSESQFTITGTGGLPPSPFDSFDGSSGWVDPSTAASESSGVIRLPDLRNSPKPLPVEAQGWRRNPDGTLRLVPIDVGSDLAAIPNELNCRTQPQKN